MDAARYHAHFYNRWFRRLKAPASWFYPGELLKDKTKFFIEQSHCPVGVFVNRNFVKASHILVYVASKEDRFLFSYAQTLAKATHGEITVAAELSAESLEQHNFMLISYKSWNRVSEQRKEALQRMPSTLILSH